MQSYIGSICLSFPHCAFSNVSSNYLRQSMKNCIGCICLTFLHCVFSNVFSNCLPERMQDHIGCICLICLHCVFFKCILTAPIWSIFAAPAEVLILAKVLPQSQFSRFWSIVYKERSDDQGKGWMQDLSIADVPWILFLSFSSLMLSKRKMKVK